MHRYVSASAHHSARCYVSSFFWSTEAHFSFGLGLSSSQSFHCSTKQWKQAVYCNAACTSSLCCCIVFALASAMKPSSDIASSFANSSAFSFPSVTNLAQSATSLSFLFLCGVLHFHQKISCCKTVQFFPDLVPQIRISCFRTNAFSSSSP